MALFRWIRGVLARGGRVRAPRPSGKPRNWHRFLLQIEQLETRLAPANTINIFVGAAGSGQLDHYLLSSNGTILVSDDAGTTETLSTGALTMIGPGANISVTAANSIFFADIGSLNLQTGPATLVAFTANTGVISFVNVLNLLETVGAALSFSAGGNLTACNLDTTTGTGSISPVPANVSLTAGSTGSGNLQFGNITASTISDLTLQASNAAGGSISQAGSSAVASGRAITVTATGNVSLSSLRGTSVGVTSQLGFIASSGSLALEADQLTLSAAAGINLNTRVGSVQAGNSTEGGISITQLASPSRALGTFGTGVVDNAPGGTVIVKNLGGMVSVNSGSTGIGIQSNNGAVTVAGTDVSIVGKIISGTATTSLASTVAGTPIDLGTNSSGTLGFSQAELAQIVAVELIIGTPTAGGINVSAAVISVGWNRLALVNGGAVTEAGGGALTVPLFRIDSPGPVTLGSVNSVGTLAASLTNALTFNNGPNALTIGTVDADAGITTAGGQITLISDALTLAAPVNAATGRVIMEPSTNTDQINLGANNAPGVFGLTDTELDEVTADVLQIGNVSITGGVTISAPVTRHMGFDTLNLMSGATVDQGAALAVANLAIEASGNVTLTNPTNAVDTLAAATAGRVQYCNAGPLTVGSVDTQTGITTSGALVSVMVNGGNNRLTVADPIDTTNTQGAAPGQGATPAGAPVTLTADNMTIEAAVLGGNAIVTLTPFTAGQLVSLGSNDSNGTLGLTDDETDRVAAGVLRIGGPTAGAIAIAKSIDAEAQYPTLALITTGGVTQASGAVISVRNLRISAANAVVLTEVNLVRTLAAAVTNTGQAFSFLNLGGISVGTVDTVAGITTNGGPITITTFAPDPVTLAEATLTINNNVTAGNAAVLLSATGLDSMIANNAAITGNRAVLTADRMAIQSGTITVGTDVSNIVTLQPFSAGRAINFDNSTGDPTGELRLSSDELNTIRAGILRVGTKTGSQNRPGSVPLLPNQQTGPADAITLRSPIAPANVTTLALLSDAAIGQTANTNTITVPNLDLSAGGSVDVEGTNGVTTIAGMAGGAGALLTGPPFTFYGGANSLTVGVVDTVAGITAGTANVGGGRIQIVVSSGGPLSVADPITSTGDNLFLQANNMNLGAAVTAGASATNPTSVVSLKPFGSGITIAPGGSNDPSTLGLDDAQLNQVHADILRIGDPNVPNPIVIAGSTTAGPGTYATLSLLTAAGVNQSAGTVTVNNLAIVDNSGIGTSGGPLQTAVGTFAARVGNGTIDVGNTSSALTIGSVDGINGVTAGGGHVTIGTSANVTVNQPVTTNGAPANVTGSGAIVVNVTGITPLNVNGLGGDAFLINLGALVAAVNASGAGGGDTLTIAGPAVSSDTYTISATQISDLHNQMVNYIAVGGVTIDAGNFGNLFNVQGTAAGAPVTLNTGTGSNAVNVGSVVNTLSGMASTLSLNGQGPTTLTINDQGDTADRAYVLAGTGITGAITVNQTGVTAVTVNGGAGSDSFSVTPSAATAFTVHGNLPNPPASPGDTLGVPPGGALMQSFNPGSGSSGTWSFSGKQPVNFDGIETLAGTADLSIAQNDNSQTGGTATPGTSLTFTITVHNAGPSVVNGATVIDVFPGAYGNPTYTTSLANGAFDTHPSGAGNINDSVTLPVGATIVYTVVGTIDPAATGTLSNTATVTPPFDIVSTNPNNSATDNLFLVPSSHIVTSVSSSPSNVIRGDALTYSITVVNQGPSDATGVLLTDTLPAGATYRSASFSQGGPPSVSGGLVTISLGNLAHGVTATGFITVVPNQEGPNVNQARVTSNSSNPMPGDAGATTTVTVGNTQVVWTGLSSFHAHQGVPSDSQLLATFTDPAGREGLSSYAATIDWGDGQTSAGTISAGSGVSINVNGDHTYSAIGHYTITITAHHNFGPDTRISTTATVDGGPITIGTLTPPLSIGTGRGFVGLVGTFVDANPNAVAGDFTVGLYWGDNTYTLGSVLLLGLDSLGDSVFAVYGFHTYTAVGHYTFSMGVYNIDGAYATQSTAGAGLPAVTVYAPSKYPDLTTYNAGLVYAQQQEQYYQSSFNQQQLNYQQFLASYWQSVAKQNQDAYTATANGN